MTVYGVGPESLRAEVDEICSHIVAASKDHLMLPRGVLRYVVGQAGIDMENKRLFGALLGRCLRFGSLDTLICKSNNYTPYWTVAHPSNFPDIDVILTEAVARAKAAGGVTVKQMQDVFFPQKEWGSWHSAQNVLGRAVALGLCTQQDQSTYTCSEALNYACSQPDWNIAVTHGGRLG